MLEAKSARSRSVPLQWMLIIPFVLQVAAAVGLVGYLSFRNGQKAVNQLADQLVEKANRRVNDRLDTYLALPKQLVQMNLAAVASGDLDINDRAAAERYFWRQSTVFDSLAYIGFSRPDGSEVGAGRWIKGAGVVLYENLPGRDNAADYMATATGNRDKLIQTYEYEPTTDTWYQDALEARRLVWTRIYAAANTNVELNSANQFQTEALLSSDGKVGYIAASVAAPFYDPNQTLLGVMSADLMLAQISEFLRDLKLGGGQAFLLDRQGLLLGSSGSEPIFHKPGDTVERFSIAKSPDPLIRTVAETLQQQSLPLEAIQTQQKFDMQFNQQRHYVQITPWQDPHGLDWLMVVALPESDFMDEINANRRHTIWLCLVALAAVSSLGYLTSRRISKPILTLKQAACSLADGELDRSVPASGIRELDAVGDSFNQMAQQLQTTFTELEQSNVQLEDRVAERTQELSQTNAQLQALLKELHQTQMQMVQSEKMSALGEMVAGVAHEINNPINFIHGNLVHIDTYTQDLLSLVQCYQQHFPDSPPAVQRQLAATDLEFLSEDVTKLLQSMKVGTSRIREIVLSLRNFSRLDESECKAVDLHQGIDNTLMILQHRLKPRANHPGIQVVKTWGELPLVECYAGQLNQVFMNILSNAIDALEAADSKRSTEAIAANPSTIWIHTEQIADRVRISFADNGPGIPAAVRSKIFNPFFTTKPVGKGTGLGLSISHQIISDKHHGRLWCDSEPGAGTKFVVEIPVQQPIDAAQG